MNKNILLAYFLGVISIVFFTVADVHAECRSCSESFGVDIKLKSGERKSGYIAWYPEIAPISVLVDKLNLFASTNAPLPYEIGIYKKLTFYNAFSKITFPVKTYVPLNDDTLEIPFEQVAQINENFKLALKVKTTGMKAVPAKDIPGLNKTPIYIISSDFYGAWREYSLAVSSSARPIDVINHEGKYLKSIYTFGELLGNHKFETSRFDCVGKKKEDLKVCEAAKLEWAQLETESREVKEYCKRKDEVSDALRKTNPSAMYQSDEYKKADMDCLKIEDKFTTKYERQLKYWGAAGFSQITLSNEYTLLP